MGQPAKTETTLWGQVPSGMTPEQFESLCTHCSKCCYHKIIVGRTVIITPFPCQFLDIEGHRCAVYAERRKHNPHCLGVIEGLKVSAFPESCPYVRNCAPIGYRPAVDTWSWDGQWKDFDDLADDLNVPPHIREIVRARGPNATLPWQENGDGQQACCPRCDKRA
jgi:hypothetical protein